MNSWSYTMPDKSSPRHFRPWFDNVMSVEQPTHVTCSYLNVTKESPNFQIGGFIKLPADLALGDTFEVDGQLYPEPITLRVVDIRNQSEDGATFAGHFVLFIYAEQVIP